MDLTEDQLLAAINRVLSGAGPEVVVGPGDDAAVVRPGSGELVLTTDAMVEGVHFRTDLTTPRDLGYKAIAVNVSDVAAMAASPRFALCALTLSTSIDAAWVVELAGGMRECCDEFALSLVGGNLSGGEEVSIVVTVTGEVVPGRAVRRNGARPGDRLVVTGSLGGSAAGLRVASQRSWSEEERDAHQALHAAHPAGRRGGSPREPRGHLDDGRLRRAGARSLEALSSERDRRARRARADPGASGGDARRRRSGEARTTSCSRRSRTSTPSRAPGRSSAKRSGCRSATSGPSSKTGLVAVDENGTEGPLMAEGAIAGWDHFR